ncbi:hypothetical protein ACFOD1_05670 [Pseudidiomarina halophila]|uniref:DUF4410 domain-containing protein n=1 Tax=Pseudidiomarina halophila TaxID=1449799 RepID=A0A432XTA9_9GAMM|nr:hypothetical protein [Pseudidiomarina halophila]RUO51952.1 hypothetical protein CWI69_09940 [Pseudidiomarina halophila]
MAWQLKTLVAAGALLLLAGCASPYTTNVIGKTRPAIAPEQVTIYTQEPESFEAIALITATSDASWRLTDEAKMEVVLTRLKEAAGKVGANGVLLRATGEQQDDSVHIGTGVGRSTGNVGFGISLGKTFGLTDKTAEGVAIYVPERP